MSRTLSTLRSPAREASATDLAARATDAAVRAADAAIRAADAAIKAADAAVRLIDEHNGEVIMLQPAPARPPGNRSDPRVILPPSLADQTTEAVPPKRIGPLRVVAVALIVAGALALVDAGVTLVWQEPFSALYAQLRQDHLSGALQQEERAALSPVEQRALVGLPDQSARIAFLARSLQRTAGEGSAVGRIRIPRIGANFVVVKGTSTAALQSGPGIFPETVFPGIAGTTAIAGHRSTYLAPFRHIDALRLGSRIMLNMPYAHFTYTVIGMRVVAPTDVRAAVGNVGYTRLVLSACTPLFSAAKRLLVFARLTATVPAGAGSAPIGGQPGGAAGGAAAGRPVAAPLPPSAASSRSSLEAVLESVQPDLVSPLA